MPDSSSQFTTVCVTCGHPCAVLARDNPTAPIRLGRCERCCDYADAYIEADEFSICLDLLLHRPAAYRHLLCNLQQSASEANSSLLKCVAALILCDAKMKHDCSPSAASITKAPAALPALFGGLAWPLLSSALELLAFTIVCWFAAGGRLGWRRLATATIYSSLGKGLLILFFVWPYPPREFGLAVEAFTLSCNFVALRVVHESLKDGPLTTQRAAFAVAAAAICRACLASALAQIAPAADAMLQSLLQPRAQTFQSRAYQFL